MTIPSNPQILTQQFTLNFSCIGDTCEDNCCNHGWGIYVEKRAFKNLKKKYQKLAEFKVGLIALKRDKNADSDWGYGVLSVAKDKPCLFQTEEGLCDIHSRYGGDQLGWVCRDFPRRLFHNGQQVELHLTLGCPEVVRLCLLDPKATQLVEADPSLVSGMSGFMSVISQADTANAYGALYNDIRQILMLLADATQYDVNGRLYLLLYFAFRVDYFFHQGSTRFSMDKLNQEVDQISIPETHAQLVHDFHSLPYDPTPSMSVIHALLASSAHQTVFGGFIERCLSSCERIDSSTLRDPSREQLAEVISTYFKRREKIEATHINRLESYFHNYLAYYLFNKSYTTCPSLTTYVRNILSQINIIKFLLFLNPMLDPLLETTSDTDNKARDEALLDRAIVETCYQCVRGFDHLNTKLIEAASEALDDQGFNTLERLTMLAQT